MVRSELVAKLVDADPHLTKRDVEIIVSIIFREIAAALARGERAGIRGFGNFSIRPRKAWNGRNLHTGTPLSVPEKHKPAFRPSRLMTKRLNGEK